MKFSIILLYYSSKFEIYIILRITILIFMYNIHSISIVISFNTIISSRTSLLVDMTGISLDWFTDIYLREENSFGSIRVVVILEGWRRLVRGIVGKVDAFTPSWFYAPLNRDSIFFYELLVLLFVGEPKDLFFNFPVRGSISYVSFVYLVDSNYVLLPKENILKLFYRLNFTLRHIFLELSLNLLILRLCFLQTINNDRIFHCIKNTDPCYGIYLSLLKLFKLVNDPLLAVVFVWWWDNIDGLWRFIDINFANSFCFS
jgi:hypothetical protein